MSHGIPMYDYTADPPLLGIPSPLAASPPIMSSSVFSVTQVSLGAPLQFEPALGTKELDDLIDAYIPGPASLQQKRAQVTLDFFSTVEASSLPGPVSRLYHVSLPITTTNTTPRSRMANGNSSRLLGRYQQSTDQRPQSRQRPASAKRARKELKSTNTTASKRLPGFSIMTRDGVDITEYASRGPKTKEQRRHAALMRKIGSCPSCKKSKQKCDPSHHRIEKSPQTASTPAISPACSMSAPFSMSSTGSPISSGSAGHVSTNFIANSQHTFSTSSIPPSEAAISDLFLPFSEKEEIYDPEIWLTDETALNPPDLEWPTDFGGLDLFTHSSHLPLCGSALGDISFHGQDELAYAFDYHSNPQSTSMNYYTESIKSPIALAQVEISDVQSKLDTTQSSQTCSTTPSVSSSSLCRLNSSSFNLEDWVVASGDSGTLQHRHSPSNLPHDTPQLPVWCRLETSQGNRPESAILETSCRSIPMVDSNRVEILQDMEKYRTYVSTSLSYHNSTMSLKTHRVEATQSLSETGNMFSNVQPASTQTSVIEEVKWRRNHSQDRFEWVRPLLSSRRTALGSVFGSTTYNYVLFAIWLIPLLRVWGLLGQHSSYALSSSISWIFMFFLVRIFSSESSEAHTRKSEISPRLLRACDW